MALGRTGRTVIRIGYVIIAGLALLALPAATAAAKSKSKAPEPLLRAAAYPDRSTFSCRTDAIPVYPGQNLNDFNPTTTCPNAQRLSGPGSTSLFANGSTAEGYITRFKPSMVEVLGNGKRVTPAVYDLHMHHVVWIPRGRGPTFAAGEEKTIATMPQGYGIKVGGHEPWIINQMIHALTDETDREVYLTWEIDWVPATGGRTDIAETEVHWLDVAGAPQLYPVFDAERRFDTDGDGEFVFPDDVSDDPAEPSFEEHSKISNSRAWAVPKSGATLVFGAGHLHPGGQHVDLFVARDGPDPGTVDGDVASEVKPIFRSDARYYEPAGAVSWDVSLEATPRDWRISLKGGDTVFINATYDVSKASWYESMGILPLAWSKAKDPAARDPFEDHAEVQAMYERGGTLTHGRLSENIDKRAGKNLKLPDPRKLRKKGKVKKKGIDIKGFLYSKGGFSANRFFRTDLMRPPAIRPGQRVKFTNSDALPGQPQTEQVWHSVTSCKAPCNKDSGIGYPLAQGPIAFDSGQLGYGQGTSSGVTTQTDTYKTPPLRGKGKTFTYFCRIHPFMRGSVRTKGKKRSANRKAKRAVAADFSGALPGS